MLIYSTLFCIVLFFTLIFALSNTKNLFIMIQQNEKNTSFLAQLSGLSNLIIPLGSIIVPLIIWQTSKNDSKFLDHHGKEAVNFNISFLLYNIVAVILLLGSIFGTIFNGIQLDQYESSKDLAELLFSAGGFITAIIVLSTIGIVKFILIIVAAVKANNGMLYRYPLTIRFIK